MSKGLRFTLVSIFWGFFWATFLPVVADAHWPYEELLGYRGILLAGAVIATISFGAYDEDDAIKGWVVFLTLCAYDGLNIYFYDHMVGGGPAIISGLVLLLLCIKLCTWRGSPHDIWNG